MQTSLTKEDIRHRIRAQKTLLDSAERQQAARKVFKALEEMPEFMMAERILMYHSLPDELSTHEFLDRWHNRKQFFLPRVNGVNLEILPYDRSRLSLGAFHIEEPQGTDTVDVRQIELIVIPAVA